MTTPGTRSPRTVAVVVVAAAAALIAVSCGGSDTDAAPPIPETDLGAATSPAATEPAPTTTAREEHPCNQPDAEVQDGWCRVDGEWYVQFAEDAWWPALGTPSTTTVIAAPVSVPTFDTAQSAASNPEQVCVDDVCVDVPADGSPVELPEGFVNHEHPPETEPGYEPVTTTTTAPEPEPVTTTTTAPEPEPVTTTTTAPEPEPVTTTTTAPEPEPVTTTTTAPEPPTTTAPLPEQVGDPIYFETNTTTNAPYCPDPSGCSPLLEIQVGTVLVHTDYPDFPATVIEVVDSEVSSLSVIWVCSFQRWTQGGTSQQVEGYLLHRWTATRWDGLYSLSRGTMGDYHRPC